MNSKVDRLITDVQSIDKKVQDSESKLSYVKGGMSVGGVLLVAGFGFLWWLIGDRVADLKSNLLAIPVSKSVDATTPAAKK